MHTLHHTAADHRSSKGYARLARAAWEESPHDLAALAQPWAGNHYFMNCISSIYADHAFHCACHTDDICAWHPAQLRLRLHSEKPSLLHADVHANLNAHLCRPSSCLVRSDLTLWHFKAQVALKCFIEVAAHQTDVWEQLRCRCTA